MGKPRSQRCVVARRSWAATGAEAASVVLAPPPPHRCKQTLTSSCCPRALGREPAAIVKRRGVCTTRCLHNRMHMFMTFIHVRVDLALQTTALAKESALCAEPASSATPGPQLSFNDWCIRKSPPCKPTLCYRNTPLMPPMRATPKPSRSKPMLPPVPNPCHGAAHGRTRAP